MDSGGLGMVYTDGQDIVRQGEAGDTMYVIQKGKAEVLHEADGKEVRLNVLSDGDFFGEMALFQKLARSATVRAIGEVRVRTVDKRILLRRVHEDPSFAFRILQKMADRIRELDDEVARVSGR